MILLFNHTYTYALYVSMQLHTPDTESCVNGCN